MKHLRHLLSVLLCVLLLAGMCFSSSALIAPQRIKSLHPQFAQELSYIELDGKAVSAQSLSSLDVRAGSELRIYLLDAQGKSLFYDQNGAVIPAADITLSRLYAAQVAPVWTSDDDSVPLEAVEFGFSNNFEPLSTAAPYLSIRFSERFVSISEESFQLTCSLSIMGQVQPQTAVRIAGTMRTEEIEVNAASGVVDLQNGAVAVPSETIPQATLRVGPDVTISARLESGQKYYGVAKLVAEQISDPASTAKSIYREYDFQCVNLDRPGNTVTIYSDITLYVYNEHGIYLGTTRNSLAVSEKYYLINKQLPSFLP